MAETPEAEEAPQVASAPRPPSQKASKPTAAAKPKAAREPTEPAGQEAALAPKAEEADDHTEEPEGETAAADEAKDTKPQVAKAPTRKPAQPKPAAEVASASTTPTVPGYGQVVGAEAEAYDEAGEQATEGEAAPGVDEEAVAEVTEPRKRRKRTALTATQKKKIDRLQESWKSLGEALEDLGSESGR